MIPRVGHHEAEHTDLPGQDLRRLGDLAPDVEDGVPGLHGTVPVHESMPWQVVILCDNHREYCENCKTRDKDEKLFGGKMVAQHKWSSLKIFQVSIDLLTFLFDSNR